MKHWCGCITKRKKGVVYFEYMCDLHKANEKYVWIAIQHKEKKPKEKIEIKWW